jgi:outer membrane protein assembly factor BamA
LGITVRFLAPVLFFLFLGTFSRASEFSYHVAFNKNFLVPAADVSGIPFVFKVDSFECGGESRSFQKELQGLLGLVPGALVTREQFLHGVERVAQKNCFEKGTFYFVYREEGTSVRFSAERLWILRSIKIQGISSGKDEYLHLYEQTAGDPFSLERHEESLEALKVFLKASGYKHGQIRAKLEYDKVTKTVVVRIIIRKGKLFTVSDVSCTILDKGPDDRTAGHAFDQNAKGEDALSFASLLSSHEWSTLKERLTKQLVRKFATRKLCEKTTTDIKKWLKGNGFFDPVVTLSETVLEDHKVWISATIILKKRKKTIFFGNHYFSYYELQKKVADLTSAGLFLPSTIAAQELQVDYGKKGFWNASVESAQDGIDKEYFIIKEGHRSSIKKVVLKGIETFDKKWVHKEFFRSVEHARFFDEEVAKKALQESISWYKKQGFWDASIAREEYFPLEENPSQHVWAVVFNEGTRRFLSGIEVCHFPGSYEGIPFSKELQSTKGALPFSGEVVSLQRNFLTKKMREQGYVHARISYLLEEEKNGFRIVWTCEKGDRVVFGKTIARGYTKVSSERVMQLLSYQEGDVWSKEKIQQSLVTLRALDIFERVSLYPSFKDLSLQERDMILMIKEDDPFEVKFRLGFAQVSRNFYFKKGSTYKAGGSFIWKNPSARADRFAIDVDYNRYEKKINASYKIPFLGDWPINTIFKAYANKYIQPVYIGSNKPLYQVLQQGFLMGVSKKQGHCDFGLTSGFEWMETNDISLELARAINFKTDLVNEKIPYFFIEPMIYADFLNETLNPTEGFFGMATIKGMFPFKESSFLIKFLAEQGTFIPLDPAVLAIRLRAGHIFRREFSAVMPPERFYLGGPYSLRGYLQDYCPPLGAYLDDNGQVNYVPQGGKTMLNANFELRVPVNKQVVWGAVFQDFGILIEDLVARGIGTSKPLAATGFGVRYMTPVGPLRFDIGWKWHRDRPEDPSYAWFLTFGNAF